MQVSPDPVPVLEQGEPLLVLSRAGHLDGQGGLLGEARRELRVDRVEPLRTLRGPGQGQRALDPGAGAERDHDRRAETGQAQDGGRDPPRGGRSPGPGTETASPVLTTWLASDSSMGRARICSRSASAPDTTRSSRLSLSAPATTQATSAPDTSRARSATAWRASSPVDTSASSAVISAVALSQLLTLGRLLVEAGVLDHDTGRRGQGDHDVLVLVGEVDATGLLGQVQVPEDLVADPHRHPEERAHRRVVLREAVRRGVGGDVVEPDRPRVVDEQPEQPVPGRQGPDLDHLVLAHAVVDEGPQPALRTDVQHAEGGVLGVHQRAGDGHDPGQHPVEGEVGRHRHDRVQEQPQPRLLVEHALDAVSTSRRRSSNSTSPSRVSRSSWRPSSSRPRT